MHLEPLPPGGTSVPTTPFTWMLTPNAGGDTPPDASSSNRRPLIFDLDQSSPPTEDGRDPDRRDRKKKKKKKKKWTHSSDPSDPDGSDDESSSNDSFDDRRSSHFRVWKCGSITFESLPNSTHYRP